MELWTDSLPLRGVGNVTSLKIIEQSAEAFSDQNEDVSESGSHRKKDSEVYTDHPICADSEAHCAVNEMFNKLCQRSNEYKMLTSSTRGHLSAPDKVLDLWNDHL